MATKKIPAIRFKGFEGEWGEKRLGDLSSIKTGFPFDSKTFEANGEYLVITNGNIQNEYSYVDSGVGNRINLTSKELTEYILNFDDILVTMDGTVGRTAKVIAEKQILAQRVGRLIAKANAEFLYQYLNTGDFFKKMTLISNGGTIRHISLTDISDYKSHVTENPSEQTQIGNYFKELDGLIGLQEQKLEKVTSLKKAMLEKMFPKAGADVPEIRFKGFVGKWERVKLGDLAVSFEYGLNAAAVVYDGINKYLRITDIDENSREFNTDSITSPSIDFGKAENYKLKNGDILFARTGASVGKTYIYRRKDGLVYFAGFLIRLRVKSTVNCEFIFQNTLTLDYLKHIKVTSQRSGQPGVNAKEYSEYILKVPSIQEQQKIGEHFKNLDELISQSNQKIKQLKNLKQAMLQKMFI